MMICYKVVKFSAQKAVAQSFAGDISALNDLGGCDAFALTLKTAGFMVTK